MLHATSNMSSLETSTNSVSNTAVTSAGNNNNNTNGASRNSSALERIEAILGFLQEREILMEDASEERRQRLEEIVSYSQLESDAKQVLRCMRNGESMLAASFTVPSCLEESKSLQNDHGQFQKLIEKTHLAAYQLQQRAESMIQHRHFNSEGIRRIAIEVSNCWQQLMTHAEDRHKLVVASLNFYKTVQQVTSVLESLETQYKTEEDFCGSSSVTQIKRSPLTSPSGVSEDSSFTAPHADDARIDGW